MTAKPQQQGSLAQQVFGAVTKDNLKLFKELVKTDRAIFSLCFGRFPLLSLCYLFKSKKIVKAFEKPLSDVFEFQAVEEPKEAYQKFKEFAGKNLRFFVFAEDKTVSPLEMLAVLKDFFYLECVYKKIRKTPKIKETIAKILRNDGFCATQTADNISVSKKPLSRFQKLALPLVFVLCTIFAVFPLLSFVIFDKGTEGNPLAVFSVEGFLDIFNQQNLYFELKNDLDISASTMPEEFLANLDGNGHKITLSSQRPFVDTLKGGLKNIEFVFVEPQQAMEVSESRGFVVNTNEGTIDNAKISFDANISVSNATAATIAVLAQTNNGTISNSTALVNLSVVGEVASEPFFAVFAGENSGTVTNCILQEGSSIVCDTVDVGGLVATNTETGLISNSTNFAEISQTTASSSWNPLVGGVVLENIGQVENCFNFANLTSISTAENATNISLQVVVGGIAAYNFGKILHCQNSAEIFGQSNNTMIFAGGIVGGNGNLGYYGSFDSVVDGCGSFGKITVNNSVAFFYIFGGGVSGYSTGIVKNSFSAMEFASTYNYSFLGGVLGLAAYSVNYNYEIITQNQNNAFVVKEKATAGSGYLDFNQAIDPTSVGAMLDAYENLQAVNTLEELKQLEVFWEVMQ